MISEAELRSALKTLLTSVEAAAETENTHKRHALTQIVERVDLPEKSEILRVHLSIPSPRSDQVKAGFYADEIANDPTFGNEKSRITGVKGGHTGVPTAFGPYFCFVSLAENLPEDRMNPRHLAAQAIAANPLITYRNSPNATKKSILIPLTTGIYSRYIRIDRGADEWLCPLFSLITALRLYDSRQKFVYPRG